MVSEEQYQRNLKVQAEEILRSWGLIKQPSGDWHKSEPKARKSNERAKKQNSPSR